MKTKYAYCLTGALCALFALTSCDNDANDAHGEKESSSEIKPSRRGQEKATEILANKYHISDIHQRTGDRGFMPIHYAVKEQDLEKIKLLLIAGSDVDAITEDGQTPLRIAVGMDNPELISFLINAGADVQKIHICHIYELKEESARLLLAAGYNVNEEAPNGRRLGSISHLYDAIKSEEASLEMIRLLILAGASFDICDYQGNAHSVPNLLGYGMNPPLEALINFEYSRRIVGRRLVEAAHDNDLKRLKNCINEFPEPIPEADNMSDAEVRIIPANVFCDGTSPLIEASKKGHVDIVQYLLSPECGAYIDIEDVAGETPLMHAAREGKIKVVKLLLQKGADPNHKNIWGKTALDLARQNHKKKTAAALQGVTNQTK